MQDNPTLTLMDRVEKYLLDHYQGEVVQTRLIRKVLSQEQGTEPFSEYFFKEAVRLFLTKTRGVWKRVGHGLVKVIHEPNRSYNHLVISKAIEKFVHSTLLGRRIEFDELRVEASRKTYGRDRRGKVGSVVFEEPDFQRGLSYFLKRNPAWRRSDQGIWENRESVAQRQQERLNPPEVSLPDGLQGWNTPPPLPLPRSYSSPEPPPQRGHLRPSLRKQERVTVRAKEQTPPSVKAQPEVKQRREKAIGEDQPWYDLV